MRVAGPGALLVAKTHKIADRVGTSSRVEDKAASLTVLVSDLLAAIRELEVEIPRDVTGFSLD